MEVTQELRDKLRRLLDEKIPPGGTDADTRFDNEELDEILAEATNIWEAAAEGWDLKASRVFSDRGGIVQQTAGDETTRWVDPEKFAEHCRAQAAYYRARDAETRRLSGGRVFEVDYGDPLGEGGGNQW